jgi:SAM-dependent methyltransferase
VAAPHRSGSASLKQYDREYFEKWYRNPRTRVNSAHEVRRKVSLALSTAEYFLRRTIRSVLDVGCGEAAWREHLRELRPRVTYLGLDPSEYVVERFGRARNIRQATFGELPSLRLRTFDLVVCSDVLHYVPDAEIRPGVAEIARLTEGIAFIEVLTREDEVIGDLEGMIKRPGRWYRNVFANAGLTPAGPYCWLSPELRDLTAELERVR